MSRRNERKRHPAKIRNGAQGGSEKVVAGFLLLQSGKTLEITTKSQIFYKSMIWKMFNNPLDTIKSET